MATKESQVRASRNWEDTHPEQAFYSRLRRQAYNFVSPKSGTKGARVISEYDPKERTKDLKKLKTAIEKELNRK